MLNSEDEGLFNLGLELVKAERSNIRGKRNKKKKVYLLPIYLFLSKSSRSIVPFRNSIFGGCYLSKKDLIVKCINSMSDEVLLKLHRRVFENRFMCSNPTFESKYISLLENYHRCRIRIRNIQKIECNIQKIEPYSSRVDMLIEFDKRDLIMLGLSKPIIFSDEPRSNIKGVYTESR